MGIYMGPTWATHKGLMRDLQQGSMLDPHGQSHVGTIWVQYGKHQPTFIFQKNNFYTNDYTHIEPYGSHTVMGGQHWNHRGPISVSHGSHLGPNYVSRKYHFSRIISILSRGSHILECTFIVIKFYQYGTPKGLTWAKKPIWGPSRTQMG